jgi:site-specific DNA recombinase
MKAAAERVRRLSVPPALAHLADVDVAAEWDSLAVGTRRDVTLVLADIVVRPARHAV